MAVGTIGVKGGNVIVPINNLMKSSKEVNIASAITYDIGGETTGWTVNLATARFIADSANVWRMIFNVKLGRNSATATIDAATITFAGITFLTTSNQAVACRSVIGNIAAAVSNTSTVVMGCASTATNNFAIAGDVVLNAEPTWASLGTTWAAIAENTASIAAYIPNMCPTISTALVTGTGTGTGGFVSGTYTTPAGVRWLRVRMVGGGGGGGGSGTSGAGNGSAGGNTTFGTSLLTAAGGGGGIEGNGGAGGSVTITGPTQIIAQVGGAGGGYQYTSQADNYIPGAGGGHSVLGGGGNTANAATPTGQAGVTNSGGGGAGAGALPTSNVICKSGGGAGGYIEAVIKDPSATYTYSVGAGGTAGSAGSSGYVGGVGGSGVIIIEEHYI